jgi:NADPH:quinone reductase-like Zn-dependent oxidoreductase
VTQNGRKETDCNQEHRDAVRRGGGLLVMVAGNSPAENGEKYGVRAVFFIVTPNRAQLSEIGKLIDEGQVTPVILPLEDARAAFGRGSRGYNTGKLVLRVARETAAGD